MVQECAEHTRDPTAMTKQCRALKDSAARDETPAKMAQPHHAPRLQEATPRGSERLVDTASKLQRFAHTPQPAQVSPSLSRAKWEDVPVPALSAAALPLQPMPSLMDGGPAPETVSHDSVLAGDVQDEPTIRDVLSAVSICNATLTSLNVHVRDLCAAGSKENK